MSAWSRRTRTRSREPAGNVRDQLPMSGLAVVPVSPPPPVSPASLPPLPEGAPANRMGLAQWATTPDHPLTARVAVNRMWQMLFGVGIVKTTADFGAQGEWPSHPELLDWLAVDFVESGWDVKTLIRQIVTSATYRQNSAASEELLAREGASSTESEDDAGEADGVSLPPEAV